MSHIETLTFSINHWQHLYSLQQAVLHSKQLAGSTLGIKGKVVNCIFLNHKDSDISINFIQVNNRPDYLLKNIPQKVPALPILGSITLNKQALSTDIQVDRSVFEELRKNLVEYADIEGIHIMVTLGLFVEDTPEKWPERRPEQWQEGQSLEIIQLDYAMKGDA